MKGYPMIIKRAEVVEAKLDEVNNEVIVKSTLLIEVEDDSHTSYITEIDILSTPILDWEVLDIEEKERQIKKSLKGRTY